MCQAVGRRRVTDKEEEAAEEAAAKQMANTIENCVIKTFSIARRDATTKLKNQQKGCKKKKTKKTKQK